MTAPSREDPQRIYRGPTAVRFAISKAFEDQYPALRNRFLNGWESPASDLPGIVKFAPYDNIEWKHNSGPALGVEITGTTNLRRTDVNDYASEEYRLTYNVRVTVWLASPSDESGNPLSPARELATRQRDDQLAILRGVLLNKPSLMRDDMVVNLSTITEAYPQPTPLDNTSKRWLVPGQLTFDVTADEWMTFPAVGHIVETGIETEVLLKPEPPAFPNIDRLP